MKIKFVGELIVEREIKGDQQVNGIREIVETLKKWLAAK